MFHENIPNASVLLLTDAIVILSFIIYVVLSHIWKDTLVQGWHEEEEFTFDLWPYLIEIIWRGQTGRFHEQPCLFSGVHEAIKFLATFSKHHCKEPHSQPAVGASVAALCVGITLSRSLRATQRGHVEECKGEQQLFSSCFVPQKNTRVSSCLTVTQGI